MLMDGIAIALKATETTEGYRIRPVAWKRVALAG
jgi:hypothetical protein